MWQLILDPDSITAKEACWLIGNRLTGQKECLRGDQNVDIPVWFVPPGKQATRMMNVRFSVSR
jgi:hypothetical protein